MVRKSLNRFYFFGLALMATLYFFGGRPDHNIPQKADGLVLTEERSSIHASVPVHRPFEIEKKEEQPTSEDDESNGAKCGSTFDNSDSLAIIQESCAFSNDDVVSRSQTEYHTPTYVRFRSILI